MFGIRIRSRHFTVRTKLILACGFLALITGMVGAFSIWALSSTNGAFQTMVYQNIPSIIYLEQAERSMLEAQIPERSLMFMKMGSPASAAMVQKHQKSLKLVEEMWNKYKALPANAQEMKLWLPFEAAWKNWKNTSIEVLKVLAEDTSEARGDAIDISMGESAVKFATAQDILDKLTDMQIRKGETNSRNAQTQAAYFLWWVVGFVAVAFLLGLIFSVAMASSIAVPLRKVAMTLHRVAEGDLMVTLDIGQSNRIVKSSKEPNP